MVTYFDFTPNKGQLMIDEKRNQDLRLFIAGMILITIIFVLFIWGGLLLMNPGTLPIKNVRVEGEFRQLSPETLQATVTAVVRGGFFNVNVETIQEKLFQNPWVYMVTVSRNWPDGLSVQVTEQSAIARWGERGLINPDAELFSPGKDTYPENLPVLTGPENTYALLLERFNQIRDILLKSKHELSSLTLNDRRSWEFELVNGPLIILGKRDFTNRIDRVAKHVTLNLKDKLKQIKLIDMRYTNGFAVKWKRSNLGANKLELENYGQES